MWQDSLTRTQLLMCHMCVCACMGGCVCVCGGGGACVCGGGGGHVCVCVSI